MTNHTYKITCEYLRDADGKSPTVSPLSFEVQLHEDIFHIINMLQAKDKVPAKDAAAFGLGLKLFGEIVLRNKDTPLCATVKPHLTAIMKEIKQK